MLYNNAKAGFVYDLYEKVFAGDPENQHDPHPRSTAERQGDVHSATAG